MSELNAGLTEDPLFVGATRPPMRWGVTYSALLFNMVFTMEAFVYHEKPAHAPSVRADPWDLHAALRPRCAILRPDFALCPHAAAGVLRELATVEGKQLCAPGNGIAGSHRPPPSRFDGPRSCAPGGIVVPALRSDSALRREFSAAQRIPYRAHVAPSRHSHPVRRLRAGLAHRRCELRNTRRCGAEQLARAPQRALEEYRESGDRTVVAPHPPIRCLGRTGR